MSKKTALELVKRLHPDAAEHAALSLDLIQQSRARAGASIDLTAEQYGKALADTMGAFPWDGPFGNGQTKVQYQARFREMGAEHLMVLRELAIPTAAALGGGETND